MTLISKISPIDLDLVVSKLQAKLESMNWDKHNNYPLCYKDQDINRVQTPKHFISSHDYKSVFFDDNFNAVTFFLAENKEIASNLIKVDLKLYVQVNLAKIYPTILHRANEECINQVLNALKTEDVVKVVIETKDIYEDMFNEKLVKHNLHPYCVFRVDIKSSYTLNCCDNC